MKTKKKALTLALCAVLLVGATFLGTLAYLTDDDAVTNTFTVGQVGLDLNETDVDNKNGTKANEYHLLPGHSYTKDPTVTVDAKSEDCYVRMLATITYKSEADAVFAKYAGNNMSGWLNISTDWTVNGAPKTVKNEEAGTISRTYEFRYKEIVKQSDNATPLTPLFTTVTVPDAVTNKEIATLAGMKIDVVAHAIQSAGFADANAAWGAWTN